MSQNKSGYDTIFDVHCKIYIFRCCSFLAIFVVSHLRQKQHLRNMFPTKCQRQNDRMGRPVISCVDQNLDFTIGFVTQVSSFTSPWLLRFLCLINSLYSRYVSCMYNVCNISNKHLIDIPYMCNVCNISNKHLIDIQYIQYYIQQISNIFYFSQTRPIFSLKQFWRQRTKDQPICFGRSHIV